MKAIKETCPLFTGGSCPVALADNEWEDMNISYQDAVAANEHCCETHYMPTKEEMKEMYGHKEVRGMRKPFSKEERKIVYDKCKGHCAYCGCEITIKEMQADHLIPVYLGGTNKMNNMLPACRSCNHRKGTLTIEKFRHSIERQPEVLMRDSVTYRNAVRFGLVIPNPHRIRFYFEESEDGV